MRNITIKLVLLYISIKLHALRHIKAHVTEPKAVKGDYKGVAVKAGPC